MIRTQNRRPTYWSIICWLMATVVFLGYTFGLTLLIGDHILKNSPQVQQVVVREFTKSLPFPVRAGGLKLDLFPTPKLLVHDVHVQMPDLAEVQADGIELRPSLAELLRGNCVLETLSSPGPNLI